MRKQRHRSAAKLISTFVLATQIVLFLYYLNPKFPAPNHLLYLCSLVCVRPVRKPHCWFSHVTAQKGQRSNKELFLKTFLCITAVNTFLESEDNKVRSNITAYFCLINVCTICIQEILYDKICRMFGQTTAYYKHYNKC